MYPRARTIVSPEDDIKIYNKIMALAYIFKLGGFSRLRIAYTDETVTRRNTFIFRNFSVDEDKLNFAIWYVFYEEKKIAIPRTDYLR